MLFVVNSLKRGDGESLKFLTLTVKSQADPLKMVRHLIDSFRRLRQRKAWMEAVSGGIYALEMTHNPAGWHVHIHAVIMAKYFAQWKLSHLWNSVSGSPVVDIRRTYNSECVAYLCKYLTCEKVPEEYRPEADRALKSCRLWSAFGTAHDLNNTYKPPKMKCPVCESTLWVPEFALNALSRMNST
jgi:hypothetical protein